jgi:hypothetical protein
VFLRAFARALASKWIQTAPRLFGVRQMMPTLDFSSLLAMSLPQRAPASMSALESHGSTALIIFGR